MSSTPAPVACTLDDQRAEAQALEWVDVQRLALRTEPVESGAEMTFPGRLASTITDLAEREAACCGFLNIATSLIGDDFVVKITSENPAAIGVIAALSGIELP